MQNLKDTSPYRATLRKRILSTAMTLFAERGIKGVKMDDIAQQLGISKRTLYEIYKDKEELLYQGVLSYNRERHDHLVSYAQSASSVIDVIAEAYRMKLKEVHVVNPLFYEDIMKYPKVSTLLKEEHERTHDGYFTFMQHGVDEGCLRPDVNYELFQHLLEGLGMHIMHNQLLKKYSVEELFDNMFLVALRGLCTSKGLQLLEDALATKTR